MKHQQVSVDYWAMARTMLTYGVLTVLGWFMFRLFNAVFTLPRRLRTQQQNIQDTLKEFQRRCPDLNITEEDLKEAEKEFEEWAKEADQKLKDNGKPETALEGNSADEKSEETTNVEKKKSI